MQESTLQCLPQTKVYLYLLYLQVFKLIPLDLVGIVIGSLQPSPALISTNSFPEPQIDSSATSEMLPPAESSNSELAGHSEISVEPDCNPTFSSASDSTDNGSIGSESSSDGSSGEEIDEDFDITSVEITKAAFAERGQESDISSADVAPNVSKATIDALNLGISNDLKESKDHTSDRASGLKYALLTSFAGPSHILKTTLSKKSDSQDLPDPSTICHELPKSPGQEKRSPVNVSGTSPKSEGWGDEPGPASWDWKEMPFDYMGILEEQRRTVFYEYREQDGKGEWNVPQYDGTPRH